METDTKPKKTVGYYLPIDVIAWIEGQAEAQNRSASNYLTTLIRTLRNGGGEAQP